MSEEAPESPAPAEDTPSEAPAEAPADKEVPAEAAAESTDAPPEAAPEAPAEAEPAAAEASPEAPAETQSEAAAEVTDAPTEATQEEPSAEIGEAEPAEGTVDIGGEAEPEVVSAGLADIPEESEPSEVSEKPAKKVDEDAVGVSPAGAQAEEASVETAGTMEVESVAEDEQDGKKKKKRKKRAIPTPQARRSLQSDDIPEKPRYRPEKDTISTFLQDDDQSVHMSEATAAAEEDEEEEEEEEESEEGSTKEQKETIDRQMYYEMYAMYSKQNQREKFKNNYLQKKMGDYYKKRRMDHALRESEGPFDTVKKYEQQLDILEQLNDTSVNEEMRMQFEIEELRSTRDKKQEQIAILFKAMQDAEVQVGRELFSSEEGKGNADRIVERLMKHQKQQLMQVITMRLHYIKCRNKLTEKQEALNALDNLGPNLHLIDYEQLKFDNRNLQDKLEERENELMKLRSKCQSAMQMLAHRREKTAALDEDMQNLRERLDEVSMEYEEAREQLNEMKMNRDILRKNITKINEQAGLLTKKLLLKDMESAMKEVKLITTQLEVYKLEYEQTKGHVTNIRKNLNSGSKLDFFRAVAQNRLDYDEDDAWVADIKS